MVTFEGVLKLMIGYFFLVWFAIIVWVTKDIIHRTNNIFYQILSIIIVLIGTPLGIVVYLLIRPSRTLFEKYYEEANISPEIDLSDFDDEPLHAQCRFCHKNIEKDFLFCPHCKEQLQKKCL